MRFEYRKKEINIYKNVPVAVKEEHYYEEAFAKHLQEDLTMDMLLLMRIKQKAEYDL